MTSAQYAFTLWYSAVVLWLTWAPFIPSAEPGGATFSLPSDPVEIILNILLLAPVGLVVGLGKVKEDGGGETSPPVPSLGLVLVLAAAISLVAEGGQLFIVDRSPSLWDLLLNSGGAVGAARLGRELGRREMNVETGTLLVWSHLYLAVLVYLLAMGSFHKGGHRLESWVGEYPVLAGEEVGGLREYHGSVEDAEICGGTGPGRVCGRAGAESSVRERIAAAAVRDQSVSLTATVVSRSGRQEGPARILTFSDGVLQRNATLAQEDDALVLRLRTPLAGSNGGEVEFHLPGSVPTGVPTRVLASYDDGGVTLRSSHDETSVSRTVSYPLLVWTRIMAWRVDRYITPQVLQATLLGVIVLFLPVGLLAATLVPTVPGGLRWSAGIAAGIALYLLMTARLGFPLDILWFVTAVGTTGAGMLFGRPGFGGVKTPRARAQ